MPFQATPSIECYVFDKFNLIAFIMLNEKFYRNAFLKKRGENLYRLFIREESDSDDSDM